MRPPLADALFEPRPLFEEWQRRFPDVMQVAPFLEMRRAGESVEDVLARFLDEVPQYPHRRTQLAAVRFYIQAIIAATEAKWYGEAPVATNHMALLDQIEAARSGRAHPIFVTFNYDRMIEDALANRGRTFNTIDDYITPLEPALIKLHGSVDWVRSFQLHRPGTIGGNVFEMARGICRNVHDLPQNAPIHKFFGLPPVQDQRGLVMPAIAIPIKEKSSFECPKGHIDRLVTDIRKVRTIVTIGWRGAESHFLNLLRDNALQNLDVVCVAKDNDDANQTVKNLQSCLQLSRFQAYGGGFTNFVRDRGIDRILELTWQKH
jgi:hypothetical protein